MAYYVMCDEGVFPSASVYGGPKLPGPPWMTGQRITIEVPKPIHYKTDPDRPGNLRAMYAGLGRPLMRDDLIEALQAAGVENLELFDAVIENPTTGEEHTNYKVFNIVGLVAAADMDASKLMGTTDSSIIDVDFDSLAIDGKKASGLRLFRLAESVNAIIVDEVVKAEIEKRGIPEIIFYDPADWSG